MTDVEAAAERVRRVKAGEPESKVYLGHPPNQFLADYAALAEYGLALLVAQREGEEAATSEWIDTQPGWERVDPLNPESAHTYRLGPKNEPCLWLFLHNDLLSIDGDYDGSISHEISMHTTRGQVRSLLRALGGDK